MQVIFEGLAVPFLFLMMDGRKYKTETLLNSFFFENRMSKSLLILRVNLTDRDDKNEKNVKILHLSVIFVSRIQQVFFCSATIPEEDA